MRSYLPAETALRLSTGKLHGWEADEQEDLEVTALGMTGAAQATILRHRVIPIARSWWHWELELHCTSFFINYTRLFYIDVAWCGAVTIKGPKNPFLGLTVSYRIALLPLLTSLRERKENTMMFAGYSHTSTSLLSCKATDTNTHMRQLKGRTIKAGSHSGQHLPHNPIFPANLHAQ